MKAIWMMLLLVLAIGAAHAEEKYRIFVSKDGRSVEARILEWDANRGRLKIELQNKRVSWAEPDVFCETDQVYIKEWIAASSFMRDRDLQVSIDKETMSRTKSEDKTLNTEKMRCELKIRNRSKQAMTGLRIEYRCFVEEKKTEASRTVKGTVSVEPLKPGASKELSTNVISLLTKYAERVEIRTNINTGSVTTERSLVKSSEEEFVGIWVRVYGPEVDGEPLFRDFSYPDGLDKKMSWE